MCGRFSLAGDIDFYLDYFGASSDSDGLAPSWNVAPTDPVYVVAERDQTRRLEAMSWGLVPHWAKDSRSIHINARQETVAKSPTFRQSLARRRCLIPADGFYEWEPADRGRTPHWIFRADGYPVGFAGIWTARPGPDEEWIRTCAIITAPASGVIASIHDRMPVALPAEAWSGWLDRRLTAPDEAMALLTPIDDTLWMERAVSKLVNSVRNNGPELLDPDPQVKLA